MIKISVYICLLYIYILCTFASATTNIDNQTWLSVYHTAYSNNKFSLGIYAENRNRDNSTIAYGYFLGPVLKYKLWSNLTLGGAYKYILLKNAIKFNNLNRLEFEIMPHYSFTNKVQISLRTRMEHITARDTTDTVRIRNKISISKPVHDNAIKSIYVNYEYFIKKTIDSFCFDQIRIIPLGIRFIMDKSKSIDMFYMYNIKSNTDLHILGLKYIF